ncbi:MAG: serine acetyltransferase [Prevotella sp.]|nr:serine acetyltransferase [Prevotella sp.]
MRNDAPFVLYRIGHFLYVHHLKRTAKLLSWLNRFLFSVWIPSSCEIGKGTRLGYWGLGTIIHSNTSIGRNCLIAQNVTIGRNFGDLKVPVIGNDVYIGAGSVVFGEITIGDNVIIGANSVVNKSIPANCTVVGNPCHIIRENRVEKYYEIDVK